MRKVRMGPKGPKRSKSGVMGTNKRTRVPRGSSGSLGGQMHKRLVNKGS